ncbi:hypothetical protein CMV_000947 [Castanea mollissima]|uniref:Autophagy-related protein n=1 Tax=Castanea mollissima TaxID=60419 RepID=A0A8J4S538_9ROSI|nr:hypothetical protein CMV_000947 [Castanea mollissima]
MGKLNSFKDQYSIDERVEDSKNIISKYPDRVPIIIERYSRTDLPEMEKKKFLVPRDMSVGQFIHILSSRLHLAPGKALFVFIKNTLPQTASLMGSIYESYKDDDGFLYMCYSTNPLASTVVASKCANVGAEHRIYNIIEQRIKIRSLKFTHRSSCKAGSLQIPMRASTTLYLSKQRSTFASGVSNLEAF